MGFFVPDESDPVWLQENHECILHMAALQLHMEHKAFTLEALYQQAKEFSASNDLRRDLLTPRLLADSHVEMLTEQLCRLR